MGACLLSSVGARLFGRASSFSCCFPGCRSWPSGGNRGGQVFFVADFRGPLRAWVGSFVAQRGELWCWRCRGSNFLHLLREHPGNGKRYMSVREYLSSSAATCTACPQTDRRSLLS